MAVKNPIGQYSGGIQEISVTDQKDTQGSLINGATAKTTPVDADMVGLMDSAASNVLKKLSWSNIKATLKTYFDTIYPSKLTSDITINVATTGNDTTGNGSSGNPYLTLTKALSMVPKNLNGFSATVNVYSGTYAEDVIVSGFYGGSLTVWGGNSLAESADYIVNSFIVNHCNCYVSILGFTMTTASANAVHCEYCQELFLSYLYSVSSAPSYCGFYLNYSIATVYSCQMSNKQRAIWLDRLCHISSRNWTAGSGNTTGILCLYGSQINKSGTQPQGTTAEYYDFGGVVIQSEGFNTSDISTNVSSAIHGVSAKTTPVDADEVGIVDSEGSNALKKITWANIKATIKTYFTSLYSCSRLIYLTTLSEEVGYLDISLDSNGNSFNLKRARINTYVPANSRTTTMWVQLNGIYTYTYYDPYYNTGATENAMMVGYANTLFASSEANLQLIGGHVMVNGLVVHSSSSTSISYITLKSLLKNGSITGITHFELGFGTGNLPIGTVIRIEGWDV